MTRTQAVASAIGFFAVWMLMTYLLEARLMTTDPTARAKFRWYWARFSPGIVLIRRVMLGLLKTEAERQALEKRANGRLDNEICGDSRGGRAVTE